MSSNPPRVDRRKFLKGAALAGAAAVTPAAVPARAAPLRLAPTATNTLLSYAFYADPDPLQVNTAATFTLVVSNGSRQQVTCTSIQLTLPEGSNAKDLIPGNAAIESRVPDGWSAAQAGGVITFTPSGNAGTITSHGIVFIILTTTNAEPGTATVTVDETASSPSAPGPAKRTATFPVTKYPAGARSLNVVLEPLRVGVNGLVRLKWEAPDGDYCTLEDGTKLPARGQLYFILAATREFTVTAYARDGKSEQTQRKATVDPSIVATETGFIVRGTPGAAGANGDVFGAIAPGGPGGRGGDAVLTRALPRLDTGGGRPARVIAIAAVGGKGGDGGPGGTIIRSQAVWEGLQGGSGGRGGDATVNITFSSAGPAAQYIIQAVAAGPGGALGLGGPAPVWHGGRINGHGPDGAPGQAGSVLAFVIDGQAMKLP
jgi:hypothetical protein